MTQNATSAPGAQDRYLSFTLSGEEYALPLLQVREVIGFVSATPVPASPPHFRGVINLRGQVIPVMDLRAKLRLPPAEPGPETSIVILNAGELRLGVIVDSVDSVLSFRADEISPPPATEAFTRAGGLLGIARRGDRLILLLNAESALGAGDPQSLKTQRQPA